MLPPKGLVMVVLSLATTQALAAPPAASDMLAAVAKSEEFQTIAKSLKNQVSFKLFMRHDYRFVPEIRVACYHIARFSSSAVAEADFEVVTGYTDETPRRPIVEIRKYYFGTVPTTNPETGELMVGLCKGN